MSKDLNKEVLERFGLLPQLVNGMAVVFTQIFDTPTTRGNIIFGTCLTGKRVHKMSWKPNGYFTKLPKAHNNLREASTKELGIKINFGAEGMPILSTSIQKLLFSLSYKWVQSGSKVANIYKQHMLIGESKIISLISSQKDFEKSPYKEISPEIVIDFFCGRTTPAINPKKPTKEKPLEPTDARSKPFKPNHSYLLQTRGLGPFPVRLITYD